MKRKYTLKFAT